MKRVRYLVGAAGLAPVAVGALAAGAAPAAAVTSHGKAVALHATNGRQPGMIPDINRVNCISSGVVNSQYLAVYTGSGTDCFANAGAENVRIYHVDDIYTGNNGVSAHLTQGVHTYYCVEVNKYWFLPATSCTSTHNGHPTFNDATMTYLRIFAGI